MLAAMVQPSPGREGRATLVLRAPVLAFRTDAEDGFLADVRARVRAYFAERGLSTHADRRMVVKVVVLLAFTAGTYALLLLGPIPPLGLLALAVTLGVGLAGIGLCVSHDAMHGALADSPRANRWLGHTSELLAIHSDLWRTTHNRMHHVYTNVVGADDDITLDPLLRLSPSAPWRPAHRWQHLYAWPLYACLTLFWAFLKDYKNVFARRLGPFEVRHPPSAVARLLLFKGLLYGWTIVVPLLVLPVTPWQFLAGFLAMHATTGLLLGTTFMLAHVVEATQSPAPGADGRLPDSFGAHQLRTTTDFARGNRLLDWCLGGLNYQVEHHLFPGICHVHYPALSRIVEETARRHGLPYHAAPTVRAALASHVRALRRLGRRPEPGVLPGRDRQPST